LCCWVYRALRSRALDNLKTRLTTAAGWQWPAGGWGAERKGEEWVSSLSEVIGRPLDIDHSALWRAASNCKHKQHSGGNKPASGKPDRRQASITA